MTIPPKRSVVWQCEVTEDTEVHIAFCPETDQVDIDIHPVGGPYVEMFGEKITREQFAYFVKQLDNVLNQVEMLEVHTNKTNPHPLA